MKLKKIIAAVAAAAVAVSTMAVSAFAIKDYPDGYTVDLVKEGYDAATIASVAGFTVKISGDIDSGVGGGAGFNSATTGWDSTEWGNDDANKAIKSSNGEITIKRDAPVFKESDATDPTNPYAQIWVQQWWGSDVTIESLTIFDKDGNDITKSSSSAAETTEAAPEETTEAASEETTEAAPEETTAPVEEEAAPAEEEAEDEDVDVDVDEEPEEEAEEPEEEAAPVEEEAAPAETEAPAETTTPAPATGNTAVATVVAVMAVAGAAAIVAKKRK